MKHCKLTAILLAALLCATTVRAQEEDLRKSFEEARQGMKKDYEDFRKQALADYSEYVRQAWKNFKAEPAVPIPEEKLIMPQLAPGADQETASWFSDQIGKLKDRFKKKGKKLPEDLAAKAPAPQPKPEPKGTPKGTPKPAPKGGKAPDKKEPKPEVQEPKPVEMAVKEVIKPAAPIPQPQPLAEVKPDNFMANDYMTFTVFGTKCKVRIGDDCRFKLTSVSEDAVADIIRDEFTKEQFDNLLYDCLQERKKHDFSDWAYYQMLLALTKKFYGEGSNEGTLTLAFLYSQSGYKMRLAHDGKKLYMLVATHHFVYNKPFFFVGDDSFFMLDGNETDALSVCNVAFPKESSLSLQMTAEQRFDQNPTGERTIVSYFNPEFSATLHSNKNYLDFYETYPSSNVDNNFMTRWAMYANTPLEEGVRNQLYPQLKAQLQGRSEKDAVQQLLWWMHGRLDLEGVIQNSNTFLYRYDEDCWGEDRAFFGEETLFYPYCDCEDRSILLSHLVRDLLGLDVILIYYPGHLAMAVAFNEDVRGDYIMLDGRKFIICDPTYLGSRVGQTMPGMSNDQATVILLQK